jgi:hypothetical protein
MNPSNPLQSEEPGIGNEMNSGDPIHTELSGIGNDIYYAVSAVSPNATRQSPRVPLLTDDCNAEPEPKASQTLQD